MPNPWIQKIKSCAKEYQEEKKKREGKPSKSKPSKSKPTKSKPSIKKSSGKTSDKQELDAAIKQQNQNIKKHGMIDAALQMTINRLRNKLR